MSIPSNLGVTFADHIQTYIDAAIQDFIDANNIGNVSVRNTTRRIPISELVSSFMNNQRPVGNLLDVDIVTAQCMAATLFYAGYANLETWLLLPITVPPTVLPDITESTELSLSEWSIIRPLFMYYLERENALYLEAGRNMSLEQFGRTSSEVIADINAYESEMHHKAFCYEIETV